MKELSGKIINTAITHPLGRSPTTWLMTLPLSTTHQSPLLTQHDTLSITQPVNILCEPLLSHRHPLMTHPLTTHPLIKFPKPSPAQA